ncbi:putative RNA-dependent RNA polymerase [Lichen partiti-like RNA virus 1]|nr:putative RNA-dependent RNA polymerase [Lichen partiti-like RNA virus 1]
MDSKINFPEDCFYCKKYHGTKNCLLPFDVVRKIQIPTDFALAIMEITHLHDVYGDSILKHNSTMTKLSDDTEQYELNERTLKFNSVAIKTGNLLSKADLPNEETRLEYHNSETQTEESATGAAVIGESIGELKPKSQTLPYNVKGKEIGKSYANALQSTESRSSWSDQVEEEILLKEKEASDKVCELATNVCNELSLPTQENEGHLFDELLKIIKLCRNIAKINRSTIPSKKLLESILYETEQLNKFGTKYKKTNSSKLDGEIAFSKELVTIHNHEHMFNWCDGIKSLHGDYCILNYDQLSLQSLTSKRDGETLEDACIEIFKSFRYSKLISKESKDEIDSAIKFELERQNYLDAYQWLANKTSLKKGSSALKDLSKVSRKYSELAKYPALDERLLYHIDDNLKQIVHESLSNQAKNVPRLGNEVNLEDYFFKLTAYFLKTNRGWKNENSFSNPSHLTKLQEHTQVIVPDSESLKVFRILKSSIDNFRISYKKKYVMNVQ